MTEFQSKMIVVVSLGFVSLTAALMQAEIAVVPSLLLCVIAVVEYYRLDSSLSNFLRDKLFSRTSREPRQSD